MLTFPALATQRLAGFFHFDDLTPEQLAEISSDDEEQGLLDEDEKKKKKKKWYQRVGGAVGGAVGGIVGLFTE